MSKKEIFKKYEAKKKNLLQILHEIQDSNPENYISKEDIEDVANFLNTSYSSIYGVVTYYSMFSAKPRGKNLVRVCNSPICNMNGSMAIIDAFKHELSIELDETTKDKLFTLEKAECLGRCGQSPTVLINKNYHDGLKPEKIKSIINTYKK